MLGQRLADIHRLRTFGCSISIMGQNLHLGALQPGGLLKAPVNQLITVHWISVSSLCPLTSPSSTHSPHCFLHSSRACSLCLQNTQCGRVCARRRGGGYTHTTITLIHGLGCCVSPSVTTNNSLSDTSSQRWGRSPGSGVLPVNSDSLQSPQSFSKIRRWDVNIQVV